jgi:hypothetical protein
MSEKSPVGYQVPGSQPLSCPVQASPSKDIEAYEEACLIRKVF